jgi:hypothetical protein
VEEGILKRDIQIITRAKEGIEMIMRAKEGIQKRGYILRRKKRTYMESWMESGRPRNHPEEIRIPRIIWRLGDHLEETRMPRTIRTIRTA